ncbi:ArsA-related P-loop ATPase [Quadrisphaera sp. GCM10027208]|uniref:ArsA-related P-loop ATPase n=1 Tax=Quadrisphaera sp. GCM10027208 TaxID=3273423 RepID=UPI00361A0293
MAAHDSDWEGVRLHVVTGKGGTGKTTVAGALALALARDGRRTLLCEVEGRQGIARLFDVPPLPYEERKVAVGPGGGDVYALAVEPRAALMEYLEMFYRLGRAGRVLDKVGAVDFATTVAPGLRDVLLTGKVYEAVRRREGAVYDAVVLDAPPTGRIAKFLNVNSEVAGIAKVGPIRNQADSIMTVLRSPQTVVHVVTLLEEMPVQETVDGVGELRAADLPVGGIVVNQVRDRVLSPQDLDAAARGALRTEEIRQGLVAAGIVRVADVDGPRAGRLADGLVAEAAEHAARVALQEQERGELDGLDRPVYELPFVPQGVDLGVLYGLAEQMCAQGMA